jgi:hypothetical protein
MSELNIYNSIRIINEKISLEDLKKVAEERFGDMVKAVVDIKKDIMAIGGDLHADEETLLLKNGSQQEDLWGVNLYAGKVEEDFIEFDSIINLRPRQNNRSRGVEDVNIRKKIVEIVNKLVS